MSAGERAAGLDEALGERFGLSEFRPGQREVIEAVIGGRDVLCVMPTGGGKSLCYQLPAVVMPGVTLVVSPLIALMKDQVDGLVSRGLRATCLNSSLDPAEMRARLDGCLLGDEEMRLGPVGWESFEDPFPRWEGEGDLEAGESAEEGRAHELCGVTS